jgi:DnaJ-domain-containing protein 1
MTTTGRRGRLFRRGDEDLDDRDADLSEDQHAWWAAREEVAGVPRGTTPPPVEEPEPETQFSDYWTAESLFDEQPKPPPPEQKTAEAELEVPGGMDLDSAHLVLQIKIGVDWEAITTAHRSLAKLYHPDRLMSYSPEAQELGRHRMSEINAAHATLRALHFH